MNVRALLYLLLVFSSSCFYCGISSAAGTGTNTVRFGQTTEDTFRAGHPNAAKVGFNPGVKGNIYQVSPDEFVFDGMKNAFILFDQNKTLIAMYIGFDGDYFSMISAIFSRKYTTIKNEKTFYGSSYMESQNEGVSIYLTTPFLFSDTSIFYIKNDEKEKLLTKNPDKRLGSASEMLDYLVEQCFPQDRITSVY
ncbi:hypothetical protein [Serratia fonticola]|uniref:hypothetical protein n=1 Tax=Serratia fonticola TaxID=47917 RepID=UPI00192CF92B|nr:hypothetical protein [Serratia fonticola]MBL5825940.1 hypothetical protein [Serratia fonticola]